MDNSLYVALTRQKNLFKQMDVVANNVANADTSGFKSDSMLFSQHLVNAGKRAGEVVFPRDVATVTNNAQGPLKPTGRPLDIAINGRGYFQVETPMGVRYTRAGAFQLNVQNQVVTTEGHRLLSADGQPVQIEEGDEEITIGGDGTIFATRRDGALVTREERGRVGVVDFENERLLEKVGNSLFRSEAVPLPAVDYQLSQGMLESSNVSGVSELTRMIKISRAVGSTGRFINEVHDLQRRAISTLSDTRIQ